MNRSLFQERAANAQILMEKITQNAETGIDEQWNALRWVANQLSLTQYDSMERVLDALEQYLQTCPISINSMYVIDSCGICHAPGLESRRWGNPDVLTTRQEECYISTTELRVSQDSTPYMYFLYPFQQAYQVEGAELTHIGIAVDMRFIDKFFDTDEYGNESVAFIIRRTGGQIYHQERDNSISVAFNILSALEHGQYSYGASHAQLVAEIETGIANCLRLEYEGKPYFVAYAPMETNGWMTVLLIPAALIGTANQAFVLSLAVSILIIILSTMGILVYFIWHGNKRVNQRLQKAVEAERSANEAKTRFLSSMSHDIRTPMNAIIGMNDLAARHIEDHDYVRNCLAKSKLASNHLLTLINDVLDISKVESGKMTLNLMPVSLADIATNLIGIIQPQVAAKEQRFDMRIRGVSHEIVITDELRINQVFINILSNAVKYTPNGGRITVDLIQESIPDIQDKVRIRYIVEDNGMGMSEEYQKNMYTAFTRAEGQQVAGIQGTGLGLAICKQMVDLLGGTIECDSALGRGTKFAITLDLKTAAPIDITPLPEMDVLLVDDDPSILDTAKELLVGLGLRVQCASGCAAALAAVAEKAFRLIIFDWEMPCENGNAKPHCIKDRAGDALILASAYAPENIRDSARENGSDGVLAKPFFPSAVRAELLKTLDMADAVEDARGEPGADLAGMHLLLAEDNDLNWEIAEAILGMYSITADRVENGQRCVEALSSAPAGTYQLVLMDIQMPVMNGYDAARAIRSSDIPHLRTIPIIAMTADAFADDVQQCKDAGMDGHIAKPIDIGNLLAVLSDCLRGGGEAQLSADRTLGTRIK